MSDTHSNIFKKLKMIGLTTPLKPNQICVFAYVDFCSSISDLENIWNVSVHTSDLRGAGTDANVFFVLYGDKGKSEEIELANESNNFERGNVDNFKVDAKDIGAVYKMRLWHDDVKLYADWHLEKAMITFFIVSFFKLRTV